MAYGVWRVVRRARATRTSHLLLVRTRYGFGAGVFRGTGLVRIQPFYCIPWSDNHLTEMSEMQDVITGQNSFKNGRSSELSSMEFDMEHITVTWNCG